MVRVGSEGSVSGHGQGAEVVSMFATEFCMFLVFFKLCLAQWKVWFLDDVLWSDFLLLLAVVRVDSVR